jgi:hypothetical protein
MATYLCPEDFTNDKHDLSTLVDWFYAHDADWMVDALWLRYLKIAKQVYHSDEMALEWSFERLHYGKEGSKNKQVPLPCAILPETRAPDKGDVDRPGALPHDIRVEILSYLFLPERQPDMYGCLMFSGHPLNKLALVSEASRDQVDGFCGHSLLVWKQLVEGRDKSFNTYDPAWVEWRKLVTYTPNARMEYMVRLKKYCGFCGARTKMLSMRWPGLLCCQICLVQGYEKDRTSVGSGTTDLAGRWS